MEPVVNLRNTRFIRGSREASIVAACALFTLKIERHAVGAVEARQESASWLTEAANTGFPCYPWFMKDPLLAPLRQTSQFRTLEPSMRRTLDALAVRYGS